MARLEVSLPRPERTVVHQAVRLPLANDKSDALFCANAQGTSVFLRKNCRFSTIAEFHEKHLSFTANRRRLAARLSIVEVKNGLIRLQRELASAF